MITVAEFGFPGVMANAFMLLGKRLAKTSVAWRFSEILVIGAAYE